MALPWRRNDDVGTACTDGVAIQYNESFIDKLNNDELVGLAIHEILHPLLDHLTRLRNQFASNHLIANAAADYELNRFATQYNATAKEKIVLPKGALLDAQRFGTRAAESIYRELLEEAEKKAKESGDDAGDGEDGDGEAGNSGDGEAGSSPTSDDNKPQSGQSPSKKSSEQSSSTPQQDSAAEEWGKFKPAADEKKSEELQKKWRELLQSCIQTAKMRGESSPFLSELEKHVQSPADLSQVLSQYMDEFAMTDDSTSPDRRHMAYHGVCVAGMEGEQHGTLVFVKDTSGSMSQPVLEQCVAVVQQACDRLRFQRIVVIDADDGVRSVEEFTPYDQIPLKAVGGGGTDFRPAFDYIETEIPEARAIVYMTDGYGAFPKYAPDTPVLWLTWGIDDYPFGDVLDLKSIA